MRPLLLLFVLALAAPAQEPPRYNLVFEKWVRDAFFDGYKPTGPAPRWSIPAAANQHHGGLPVNLAFARHGTAVELGDALRHYEIDQPFILVLGFWRQDGDSKRVTGLFAPEITAAQWRKLWGPITYNDLLKFDALIKDPGLPAEELRRLALKLKNSPPFTDAVIQVNPRIGTDGQRRLLCSLRFADVFGYLVPEANQQPQSQPALWGVRHPGPILSPAREGN